MKSRIRTNHTAHELNVIERIADFQKTFGYQFDGTGTRKEYYLWRPIENGAMEYRKAQRVAYSKCYIVPDDDACFIVSYQTVIGMYSRIERCYYSTGAYSATTYQHERKALKALTDKGYHINKVDNLWIVDNFAS